jgi:hypothetical protein
MLEMALAAFLFTIAIVAISGKSTTLTDPPAELTPLPQVDNGDLPCPWCRAQTAENDDHCQTCGQRFG